MTVQKNYIFYEKMHITVTVSGAQTHFPNPN